MLDAEVLSKQFACARVVVGDDPSGIETDTLLYLENTPNHDPTMHKVYHSTLTSKSVWSLVNIDWLSPLHLATPGLSLVVCKTAVCTEVVLNQRQLHNYTFKVVYTKFTSNDLQPYSHNINWNQFIHVAGRSPTKNTAAVIFSWVLHPEFPPLTILANNNPLISRILTNLAGQGVKYLPKNIRIIEEDLPTEEFAKIVANAGVHICPSGVEGFGHYLNEARSIGAVIISVDHAPMNELVNSSSAILITPSSTTEWGAIPNLDYRYAVIQPPDIINAVERVMRMSEDEKYQMGRRARERYEADTAAFELAGKALDCLRGHSSTDNVEKCGINLL
eukprot:c6164_g1_i1.p1 GENE.c6164_g1_i1~~c6164_g1_i1.p1  ORF type:complete len:387 (+),score=38.54 c6164_g1_i1:163-1161(+)